MWKFVYIVFACALSINIALGIDNESKLRSECENGDKQSCKTLVFIYAYFCLDENNAIGCHNLGALYNNGQGVRQDFKKASELYQKACDLGAGEGCFNLGIMLVKGQGVRQNKM